MKSITTLSTQGIVKSQRQLMATIFNYYITADKSQTHHYKDQVFSLKFLYSKYKTEPHELSNAIKQDLTAYYNLHFNIVTVVVTVIESQPNYFIMAIEVETTVKGRSKKLSENLRFQDSQIVRITN